MCATNIWAVNAHAFTAEFESFSAEALGVTPERSEHRIVSRYLRRSAVTFTLTPNMCDCGSLIGARGNTIARSEVQADQWLRWLTGVRDVVPHVTTVGVLNAWNPPAGEVRPAKTRVVPFARLTEAMLRGVGDDALLVIHDTDRGASPR